MGQTTGLSCRAGWLGLGWLLAAGVLAAEGARSDTVLVRALDPPAGPGAQSAQIWAAPDGGELLLSWLEPTGSRDAGRSASEPPAEHAAARHALRFARLETTTAGGEAWSRPSTIVEDDRFWPNWADVPSVVRGGDGALYAHRLRRTGDGAYDYAIELLRAPPGALAPPFARLGILHDDRGPGEHGFVSLVPASSGVRAFWLDGREMARGGPMTLRTRPVGEAFGAEEALDARVCECCPTAAAATPDGELVVYRDRSEQDIRDVYFVRRSGGRSSTGAPVHHDGWRIDGCPVNGPALAVRGDEAWVAWFTSAGELGRVLIARAPSGAGPFGPPLELARGGVLGRLALALDARGAAWAAWLERAAGEPGAVVRVAEVRAQPGNQSSGQSLAAARALEVARVAPGRATGIPRLARFGERLMVVWRETKKDAARLRAAVIENQ